MRRVLRVGYALLRQKPRNYQTQRFLSQLRELSNSTSDPADHGFEALLQMLGNNNPGDPLKSLRLRVYKHVIELEGGGKLRLTVASTARQMAQKRNTKLFQGAFEKVILYRHNRQAKEMLKALQKMDRLQPGNPTVQYGYGEVYASRGITFDAPKAIRAFQKFLDLVSAENLETDGFSGSRYTAADSLESLRRMSSIDSGGALDRVRMQAHQTIQDLRENRSLFLVSSLRVITGRMKSVYRELERHERGTLIRKDLLAETRRQLDLHRKSRSPSRASDINETRQRILELEKALAARLEFESELGRKIDHLEAVLKK